MATTSATTTAEKINTWTQQSQPPTSKSEIYAWWIYYVGYEPLSIVALQVLISVIMTKYSIAQSTNLLTGEQCQPGEACILFKLGALKVSPLSFSYFIAFLSIFCQAICFSLLGAMADFGNLRKRLLMGCTVLGGIVTLSFSAAFSPKMLWLASLLSVLISTVYGAALVFYNAYLPILVNNHISLQLDTSSAPAAAINEKADASKSVLKDQLASSISTKGVIAGYSSALLVLILAAVMIIFVPYKGMASVAVSFTGLWWLAIGLPSLRWFKERPGTPLDPCTSYLKASLTTIRRAIHHVRGLPDTMRFLVAYLFISGGYGTIGYAAVTFATKELGISEQGSLMAVIVLLLTSMLGGFTFMMIQRLLNTSSLNMMIALAMLECLIPIYGMIGIFTKQIGLRNLWEAYLVAGYHGFIIGAIQSFTRVSFSELLPKGRESESFALYAITERLGSSVGLFMMTAIDIFVKESRWSFLGLLAMLLFPLPLLIKGVNFERGRRNAAIPQSQ